MSKNRYRTPRRAACLAVAAALLAGLAAAAPAGAATGGASPFASTVAGTSTDQIAFTAWRVGGASWYGPGLYGRRTACGQRLRKTTVGVAHKTLPCGTLVKFMHRGRVLVTRVIDRGPYIRGRAWDLTEAASEALDFESVGVGKVRYAVALQFASTAKRR